MAAGPQPPIADSPFPGVRSFDPAERLPTLHKFAAVLGIDLPPSLGLGSQDCWGTLRRCRLIGAIPRPPALVAVRRASTPSPLVLAPEPCSAGSRLLRSPWRGIQLSPDTSLSWRTRFMLDIACTRTDLG